MSTLSFGEMMSSRGGESMGIVDQRAHLRVGERPHLCLVLRRENSKAPVVIDERDLPPTVS
jgi:hypothetical protein